MKTRKSIKRALIPLLLAAPFWVSGYTFTKDEKTKEEICLELSGKVVRSDEMPSDSIGVQLIEENKVVDSRQIPASETFVFRLKKNRYYSIRVYQQGCAPRLVSISTHLKPGSQVEKAFKFHFDLIQMNTTEDAGLNDVLDFPVAIITFDETKGYFDYNASYTSRMKDLYKKIRSSSEKSLTAKL